MSNGKIDVSLDLGYGSIGWCVAEENGREPLVRGCGTVVFEPDRCLASARRGYRRQRRHIRATRTRIRRMRDYLTEQGVLTPAVAGLAHPNPEPWRLAAQALRGERTLDAAELWAVLLWYAHNRGYDGNRLWSSRSRGTSEETELNEDSKKVAAAKAAMAEHGRKTMAETVLDIVAEGNPLGPARGDYKVLNLAFDRGGVMAEVETILRLHVGKIPGLSETVIRVLMADPLRDPDALRDWPHIPQSYLGGLLAGQVKPRFDNRLATRCPIDGVKTPLKSSEAFLAFRWAELLSHVRVGFAGQPLSPLTPETLAALDAGIRRTGRYTVDGFKRAVRRLAPGDTDNLDALLSMPDAAERLVRYPGLAKLDTLFGVENFRQDAESQRVLRHMSHALAKGKSLSLADLLPLLQDGKAPKTRKNGKSPAEAFDVKLPAGRAPYSERVMRQAVAEIFAGKDPRGEGGMLYRDATQEDPLPEAEIDRATNNHLVRHRIKIMLRLLGDIVHDYAENNPARIGRLFVEVARDIRDFSGKKKKEIETEIGALRQAALRAAKKAAEALGCDEAAVTAGLARKMRIAADLNFTCPYTGRRFDVLDIRNKVVDLDHILPRSRRATDSLDALVLTFSAVNKRKGARTALQFIRDCGGQTISDPGPDGIGRTFQIKTEEAYLRDLKALKQPPSAKERKIFRRRLERLKMFAVEEDAGMTDGMLTQTSAIAKLAHRAIMGWFRERGCKPIRPTLIPGRVTKEVRVRHNLLGMLAQFDVRLLRTYTDLDGVTKTDVIPKGEMRGLTHMHHAVDAVAILLAGTLITPAHRVWDLMVKRHQTEEERAFLLGNGPFRWDGHGNLGLQPLPAHVERSVRAAIGELRTVRYASKRLGRTVIEETQWRVERVENGRVFIRQGHGAATKRDELAISAAYGLNPPSGDGKLKRNKAIYVGDGNYAIALSNPPVILRERFVWRELQALAAKNGGEAPKLLRKGDLLRLKDDAKETVWMIRSIKDNKGTLLLDLTVPYNAESLKNKVSYCRINNRLTSLLKQGVTFPRYRLTGIPACPITSSRSQATRKRSSSAKTDSSSAE